MTQMSTNPERPAPAAPEQERASGPLSSKQMPASRWLNRDLFLALGVLALAAFLLDGALRIRISPGYAHIGPRFFPFLVSAGLGACGVVLLVQALRSGGRAAAPEPGAAPLNLGAVAIIAGALLVQIFLMERAGFVIASTVLFAGVAAAFGSRRHLRDAGIGLVLAFVVYWAFTQWLGLRLPGGFLTPLLARLGGS